MREETIRLEHVTQIIDGITQLNNFNMHIFAGEIMGLVGINDHGIDSLLKLLLKNDPIYYGYIYYKDKLINSYLKSLRTFNEIAIVGSKNSIVSDLSVAENVFVLSRNYKKHIINHRQLENQMQAYIDSTKINISASTTGAELSFFEQCVVEILRAVTANYKLIVIKDISSFISESDLVKVHKLIRHFASFGFSFLYICNHHKETFEISDRASIMENGRILKILSKNEMTDNMMHNFSKPFFISPITDPSVFSDFSKMKKHETVFSFNKIFTENINDLSFSVKKGECLVLHDINNTVFNDIISIVLCDLKPKSGNIFINNQIINGSKKGYKHKMAVIDEKPAKTMVFKDLSYIDNMCVSSEHKASDFITKKTVEKSVRLEYFPLVGDDIFAPNLENLSIYSLYNLVYYRVHLQRPNVVFCVQPFAGADMYLRMHIINLIEKLKKQGIAIVILAVNVSDSLIVADRFIRIGKEPVFDSDKIDF
jgi:ABC-type sugar transport system, ATPase component